ncbi:uncharacterized protein [Hoplias malabaricus]|uniref:uncharacterized protein isoform X1 n=1 Tax=Hoplias malabaricus TaxID=27720 RepID=UPI003463172E
MRKTWLRLLVLSFLCFCTDQADSCAVGVLGESVSLPCLYNGPENLTSVNISLEWRKGPDVVYKAVWTEQHEHRISINVSAGITMSSLAQTGNFTMVLSNISFSDAQNYSLHLYIPGHGASALICTICLTVAAGAESTPVRETAFIWILSIILCVLVIVLVTITLCFQKKWDKQAKKKQEDDSDCEETEMIMLDTEYLERQPTKYSII